MASNGLLQESSKSLGRADCACGANSGGCHSSSSLVGGHLLLLRANVDGSTPGEMVRDMILFK